MVILEFNDYLTGEKREYKIKSSEIQLDVNCPIDGTFLIEKEYFPSHKIYFCPNCDSVFADPSRKGFLKVKEEFMKMAIKRIDKNNQESKNLTKFLLSLEYKNK
jgi:transposase-like protein